MTEKENELTVDLSVLLNITRQKLITTTLLNTELEALVAELRARISELENNS